jgi:hypothetical protein
LLVDLVRRADKRIIPWKAIPKDEIVDELLKEVPEPKLKRLQTGQRYGGPSE